MLKRTKADLNGYQGPIDLPQTRYLNRVLGRSDITRYFIERAGEWITEWGGCTQGLITGDGYGWLFTCHIGIGLKEVVILIPRQEIRAGKKIVVMDRSVGVYCKEKATVKSVIAAVSSFTKALRRSERERQSAQRRHAD